MTNKAILIGLLSVAATVARAQQEPHNGRAKVRAEITLDPVLHIELGSGAHSKDGMPGVVSLDINSSESYRNGVPLKVDKLLKAFAMGVTYSVWAELSNDYSKETRGELYKILQLNVGRQDVNSRPTDASDDRLELHISHGAEDYGERELYGAFLIKPMTADNTQAFNHLLGEDGKPKTYSIYVTYTIAPR